MQPAKSWHTADRLPPVQKVSTHLPAVQQLSTLDSGAWWCQVHRGAISCCNSWAGRQPGGAVWRPGNLHHQPDIRGAGCPPAVQQCQLRPYAAGLVCGCLAAPQKHPCLASCLSPLPCLALLHSWCPVRRHQKCKARPTCCILHAPCGFCSRQLCGVWHTTLRCPLNLLASPCRSEPLTGLPWVRVSH